MGLRYSECKSYIHSFSGKSVLVCHLGALGVGALPFDYDESYLEYDVCTGCIQGDTEFNKEGKLKDFV